MMNIKQQTQNMQTFYVKNINAMRKSTALLLTEIENDGNRKSICKLELKLKW